MLLMYRVCSCNRCCCCVLNVQMFCVLSTAGCLENWTHIPWLFTCINVTRWHSKNCSQSSLWQIVQSKRLRRCWTSSWNSLTLSTCVSLTSWSTPDNITSICHWSTLDIQVSIAHHHHHHHRRRIIRTLRQQRPVALISFPGNVRVLLQGPIIADEGCGDITNLLQPSLPRAARWYSPARRRAYLGTASIDTLEVISSRDTAI